MSKNTLRDKLDGDELDLSMMCLTEVPVKEISALPRATKIDLSSNQLTSLPGNFATSLNNVTRLELGSNKIKELPENFYKLQNLRQLDLYNNQLTDLPLSFCQLPNLKWLDLKGNPLNPVLRKVAGDCLNQKECEAAARNIVAHLKRTTEQMEAEQEEKLRKQKEKKEAKAKAEEAKLAKQRAEKKAAKEKRKAETRAILEAQKTKQANGSANTDKKYTAEPKPKPSPKHKKESKASGWSFLGWVNLVLSVILVGAISAGLYVYTDGDLSPTALSAALPRIAQNTDHIARLLAESFQPDHLKQTAQSMGETVSDTCSQLWTSVEEYTGDLSTYTKPVAEGLTVGWLWLREHAILSYDWITNNVDWNSVLQAIKAAALFLYEQLLVACEELSKNQALMSLLTSLRRNTAVVTDYLVMAAEVVWAYILQVVEYIQTEGPGILEVVKEQAAGAIHTVKQSMEGLVK